MSEAEAEARAEICRVGASLFDRGYVHGTAGNISVRLDDGDMLITPTDASLGALRPERLARAGADLQARPGPKPSKTLLLHARIVAAARGFDADVACVIHTHSSHCVALSMDPRAQVEREWLAPLTPYFVMKVGHVPLIPYHRPGDPRVATLAEQAIKGWGERGAPIRAIMLERLGPVVWHRDPGAAMAVLEELEETAKLQRWLGYEQAPLSPSQIQALREQFGARW